MKRLIEESIRGIFSPFPPSFFDEGRAVSTKLIHSVVDLRAQGIACRMIRREFPYNYTRYPDGTFHAAISKDDRLTVRARVRCFPPVMTNADPPNVQTMNDLPGRSLPTYGCR